MAYDFELLTVEISGRVATVTISNPPVNVITLPLLAELEALSQELKADPDLLVVVMQSADPDFFLAHFDVAAIVDRPTSIRRPAVISQVKAVSTRMCERYRTMDKVIIAQIEGRIGGGGSELAASFDMRFGVKRQDQDQPDGSAAGHPAGWHRYPTPAPPDRKGACNGADLVRR